MGQRQTLLSDRIVWFNLRRVWVPLNAETLDKFLRDLNPIFVGVSNKMGVKVASCSIELSVGNDAFKVANLLLQSKCDVGNFLSHS